MSLAEFERESQRFQSVLAEVPVMQLRDSRAVFAVIAATVARAMHVDRVSLWRYNDARSAIICEAAWQHGEPVDDSTVISNASHPTYWAALHADRTLAIADAVNDPRLVEFQHDYVLPLNIGAMLDTSVRVDQTTFGIVCIEQLAVPRTWTLLEQIFVASLGDRVGLAILVDEHRKLEAAMREAHKMEALGLMAGGVAHDFNNVLGVVIAASQSAREALDHGDDPRIELTEIENAAQRAAAMVRRLLDVARHEALSLTTFDLNEAVREFRPLARRLVPDHVLWVDRLASAPSMVHADRAFIDQALLNLVTNAAQAMPEQGVITIESEIVRRTSESVAFGGVLPPGEYVRLGVRDTGAGIPEELLTRVFDPFFTTKGSAGTGLGLSIVYRGMQQHEGFVAVRSEEGRGTEIELFFPLAS